MHIIINNSSMVPIYEQIMDQIKAAIVNGELMPGNSLPSVRGLAKELRISALTVKKAYDNLEGEGFTVTVQGKGTFVVSASQEFLKEEHIKNVENEFEQAVAKARRCGLDDKEIRSIFELTMERE